MSPDLLAAFMFRLFASEALHSGIFRTLLHPEVNLDSRGGEGLVDRVVLIEVRQAKLGMDY